MNADMFSNNPDSFENNEKQIKIERFFSDLFFGNIKNEADLSERLLQASLPEDFTRAQTLIITLTIEKFDEYLKKKFRYGREELYSLISEIAFQDSKDMLFATVLYSYNNIGIVAIKKDRNKDLRVSAEKYCQRLSHDLLESLEIISTIKISKEFVSLGQIVEADKAIELTETSKGESIRNEIMEYLSNNYFNDISLADLADYMCYNKVYFCSFYRKYMNENSNKNVQRNKSTLKITIIITLFTALMLLLALYVTNSNFRLNIDKYVFRKQLYEDHLPTIEINSDNNPSIHAYNNYITILSKNKQREILEE